MPIALVTTADRDAVHDDLDRPILEAAFARAGVDAELRDWEDGSVAWDAYDLVVVHSPWNYVENETAFRRFLARFRDVARFHNPVDLIEWNMDKRYLRELAERGVPVVPTVFVEGEVDIDGAFTSIDASEVVVKPTVSAGSRLTGRYVAGDGRAPALVREILYDGRAAMVQPYLPDVDVEGEYAAIVIDGEPTHRARKAQILAVGGTFVGGAYREVITPTEVDGVLEDVVRRAADACREIARERGWLAPDDDLLYARYDVARTPEGDGVLLEAELFEPALFLPAAPATADRLVEAVVRRIGRVG